MRHLLIRAHAVCSERKRAISCTFAGGVRPITIDVMYCTDYRDRSTPQKVAIIGFARELPEAEVEAEIAAAGR